MTPGPDPVDPTADDPAGPVGPVGPVPATDGGAGTEVEERAAEPAEPADLALQAVLAVPGVHDVHAGVMGEVTTLLPGRRINGLRLHDGGCEVHLVVEHGVDVVATADRVRQALRGLVDGPVDITVEDVVAPGAQLGAPRDQP